MILGHVVFGDINYMPNVVTSPASVVLMESDYDQIRVDSTVYSDPISLSKEEWLAYTVLQSDFESETLDAGVLNTGDHELTHIALKRKRYDDMSWTTVERVSVEDLTSDIYSYTDKMADPAERYEYAVVPCNGFEEYDYYIQEIDTEMDTTFLYDKNVRYELYYNFEFGDFVYNMPNETIETMGRKYPIVVYNSALTYAEGSLSCLLYTGEDDNINYVNEKKLRREILDFLTNRKPKGVKSFDGTNMMIAIVNTPTLSPFERGTYQIAFEFVEIGDMNNQYDLYTNDFIDIPTESLAGGNP